MEFTELEKLSDSMESATEEERMLKLKEFFPTLKIKVARISEDSRGANQYKVTISNSGEKFNIKFTDSLMNTYNNERSSDFDILYCAVVDAQSYENSRSLEDFADEFGYDLYESSEKKKIEKIYNGCEKAYTDLQRVFGYEGYEILNAVYYCY